MKKIFLLAAALGLPAAAPRQDAKLAVACTLPVLEALAREVGGDDFEYFSLAKADQDPHKVSATPVLQRKLGSADLFVEVGLQLEIWADLVADKAGRKHLMRGGRGRVVASAGIPREQIPAVVNRAAGHIHAEGNPHLWLDPVRAAKMAENIARALGAAAPARKEAVEKRLRDFRTRIAESLWGRKLVELVGAAELERRSLDGTLFAFLEKEELDGHKLSAYADGWLRKAQPLRGKKLVEFHPIWIYAAKALGFEIAGTIEEKPGIDPGTRHLLDLERRLKEEGIVLILVDNFYHPATPRRLSEDTGVPLVILPNQPGGEAGTETYFKFFDHVVEKMAGTARK